MKYITLLSIFFISLLSCDNPTKSNEPTNNPGKNPIEGSWKLVYADIREKDSIQVKNLDNTDFIKIINASHFAFFNQDRNSSDNFVAGGGTYEFNGSDYIETLSFIGSTDFRGHVFKFKAEIKGDSLIQQGHEKIESANVDRYILEKYIRIK